MNMIPTFIKVIRSVKHENYTHNDYWFGFLEASYNITYDDINDILQGQPLFDLNNYNGYQLESVIDFYHDKNIPIQVITVNADKKTIIFGPKWVLIADSKVDKLIFDSKENALAFLANQELSKFYLTKTYFVDV